MPAAGQTALYRPPPPDFDQMYAQLGWSSICAHYRAHWITVRKWIELRGRERLRAERAAFLAEHGKAQEATRIGDLGCRSRAAAEPMSAAVQGGEGRSKAVVPTAMPSTRFA